LAEALGPLCAFLSSLTWAVGSAQYARLSREHSAFAVNFTRALVALPCFVLAVFLVARGWDAGVAQFARVGWRHWGWFAASMVCSYGLGDVLFYWSARSLGVPGALAIASSYPVITALIQYAVFGQALARTAVLGLFAAVGGVITVIMNAPRLRRETTPRFQREDAPEERVTPTRLDHRGAGVVLAFTTALLWAGNTAIVARVGGELEASVANTVRMISAMGISLTLSRVLLAAQPSWLQGAVVRRNLWLFFLEGFGGSWLFMYGLAHSPLVLGSTLASLAPVIAVPVAWFMRTEKPSGARTLGVMAVVLGLYLLVRS
jgi:drug/metabolite transporter (DMT)-like permease